MDADHFEDLLRSLAAPGSRRAALAAGAAALAALLGLAGADAKRKKQRRKKRRNPCAGRPDDAACDGTGRCLAGRCNPRPTCLGRGQTCAAGPTSGCCSGRCLAVNPPICGTGGVGAPCYSSADCSDFPAPFCVGYRCRA